MSSLQNQKSLEIVSIGYENNERADLPEMDVQISNTQASISNKEFNIFENVPEKSNQKIQTNQR
jgi:hypothetical protein